MAKGQEPRRIIRSGAGLREALFEQLELLRDGQTAWTEARSFAELANTIIKSVEVEMDYARMRAAKQIPDALPAMPLGGQIEYEGDKRPDAAHKEPAAEDKPAAESKKAA